MKSFRPIALAASLAVFCSTAHATHAQQDLAIQMQPTKDTILLGEPDWVDVSVTNRSSEPLRYDMGVDCPNVGFQPPLKVEASGAEPGDGKPKPCFYAGNCLMSYPSPVLAPGETFTRRYVLSGDFRIVHPGRYDVTLEKAVRYGPPSAPQSSGEETPLAMSNQETAQLHFVLVVLPPDPAELLAIEQVLAQQVTGPVDTGHKTELEEIETRDSIAKGLAAYPVAGMEPIFDDWMVSEHLYEGLAALMKLNTADSRRFIAEAADPSPETVRRWYQRIYVDETPERAAANERALTVWRAQAIDALGSTGDQSYVALVERLATDPAPELRNSALGALEHLGGEKGPAACQNNRNSL